MTINACEVVSEVGLTDTGLPKIKPKYNSGFIESFSFFSPLIGIHLFTPVALVL